MTRDYKDSVFLPQTNFPMRAGLPQKEPDLLAFWREKDLYAAMRADAKGREAFILHDGPPFANGHIHMGHALNKILKDVAVRSKQMQGYDAAYVPGWDCHGLPIEWKIEEEIRASGQVKEDLEPAEIRTRCRAFAQKWVDIQSEEFQRLGISGDWGRPYITMEKRSEALIAAEMHEVLRRGGLFKGVKPVMWSVVEKTALADAEIEYREHKSITVWVKFPIQLASVPALEDGVKALIWTTTPWTLPGNRAIAYGEDMRYQVVEVEAVAEDSKAEIGEKLLICEELVGDVMQAAKVESWKVLSELSGEALAGTVARHPLDGQGYDFDVPLLAGDFVTTETGTGLVHIAPGHGADDYNLGMKNGIEVPETVAEDGTYYPRVPLFAGAHVYDEKGQPGDANIVVLRALLAANALLAKGSLKHSYPHSWRSKAPLIFRTTPQWFISMETNDLRKNALAEIDKTVWYPAEGRNRIEAMIEQRPDWCISRQRAWGVPIAVFVSKETGEILKDEAVLGRIIDIFKQEGSDAWFTRDPQEFLGNEYSADDYEQVRDIVDVWFESGATHAFVLDDREDLNRPADLYLEGSDQHRGWFQSSLLESVSTGREAPYKGVFTHGFVLDEKGYKFSKSSGNAVKPETVIEKFGADILRLWAVGADYHEDIRIGDEIIKHTADLYRRLRNTLRYLLGALRDFRAEEAVDEADMPELERYILHRLWEEDEKLRTRLDNYELNKAWRDIHHFCTNDLSAFYFDIRKDALYCDDEDSLTRRSARTVMNILFSHLTAWIAPVLVYTAEEAWQTRRADAAEAGCPLPEGPDSVHLRQLPEVSKTWKNEDLADKWNALKKLRRVMLGALEIARNEKRIGGALQAEPVVYLSEDWMASVEDVDLAQLAITSAASISDDDAPEDAFSLAEVDGVAVFIEAAEGEKCGRCWQILPEVGTVDGHDDLCIRCAGVMDGKAVAAA